MDLVLGKIYGTISTIQVGEIQSLEADTEGIYLSHYEPFGQQ